MVTINTFSKDEKHLGATTGMISILHSWGQQLTLHPHLHCIIPSGGLTKQGKWKQCKTKGNYLFPVKALSVVYRAKYIFHLRKHVAEFNLNAEKQIVLSQNVIDACFKKNTAQSIVNLRFITKRINKKRQVLMLELMIN